MGGREDQRLDEQSAKSSPPPSAHEARVAHAKLNPARVRDGDPEWRLARREVYAGQAKLDASLASFSAAQAERYVIRRFPQGGKSLTLTFDDGPHPLFTPKLLDLLDAAGVKATFFVIGFMGEKYPELVQDIHRRGHEVANHTYSHVTLTKLSRDEVLTEYRAANDVIRRLTGEPARFCRPPGGDFDQQTLECAEQLGLRTVLWTDDPGDYANPGDRTLLNRELARLSSGGIILLHDGSTNTLDTLTLLIDKARSRGFRFQSLASLR